MSSELEEPLMETQTEHAAEYSDTVIDHAQNPRNVGNIPNADGFGSATGQCGDTLGIWLKIGDDRIKNITFWTDGCGTSIAVGSIVTELARDKTVIEAMKIDSQAVLDALGGLPEDHTHCAQLGADTLRQAIADYLKYKNEPWKRAYRKQGESY